MLAVVVSPHGFTTALLSEASIVLRASHREITFAACLSRVLGAEPQVRCRFLRLSQLFIQLRVAPLPPNRTCGFRRIQLSSRSFRCPLSCGQSRMDRLMTEAANDQGLSSARCHDLD